MKKSLFVPTVRNGRNYDEKAMKKMVEVVKSHIQYNPQAVPVFVYHLENDKEGTQNKRVPQRVGWIKDVELSNIKYPSNFEGKMNNTDVPCIYGEHVYDNKVVEELVNDGVLPHRSVGVEWRQDSVAEESYPVITHVAILPENHTPYFKFNDNFKSNTEEIIMNPDEKKLDETATADPAGVEETEVAETPEIRLDRLEKVMVDLINLVESLVDEKEGEGAEEGAEEPPKKKKEDAELKDKEKSTTALPIQQFDAELDNFELSPLLTKDNSKIKLTKEQIKSAYKAYFSGDVNEFINALIQIAPKEDFSPSSIKDNFEGSKFKNWNKPDIKGISPKDVAMELYGAHLPEKDLQNKYYGIKKEK